jgi:hypothetical protein
MVFCQQRAGKAGFGLRHPFAFRFGPSYLPITNGIYIRLGKRAGEVKER